MGKIACLGTVAAAFCAATALAADRTIDANYTLAADETVDGVLTVAAGATVDLNGHSLTVQGLAGDGTIACGLADLTSPDPGGARVTWTTSQGPNGALYGGTTPLNLFNNNYVRDNSDSAKRLIVEGKKLPLAVTYDFGANSLKRVDMYKLYCGPLNNVPKRGPKTWTFEGSNDNATWTELDARDGETWTSYIESRTYVFENTASYRYYRITFTAATATDYLELVQLEYFDSSSRPAQPAELRVNVPAGAVASNSTVTIDGSVRLVKEGAGTFVAAKLGQVYSGGNRIVAGTLSAFPLTYHLFGVDGSDIIVEAGATFDVNSATRCSSYYLVLNGGTLTNLGRGIAASDAQLGDTTLTADSSLDATNAVGFYRTGGEALFVDLGGHVLNVTVGDNSRFMNASLSNGTVRIVRGTGENKFVFNVGDTHAETVSFDIDAYTGLYDPYSVTVSNLLLRAGFTTHLLETASGTFKVLGTFKTETTEFPYVKLMDGSRFDIRAWTGTFDTASSSANPNGFRVSFDAGATVTVDVAGRTPSVGDCLIAWMEKPADVTFQFDAATAAGGISPVATERGLLYGALPDVVEKAWWTGSANDGDLSNPQNWHCLNFADAVLEGCLPSDTTRVYLAGALNVQAPVGSAFQCEACVMSNCTLAADCDLRGLGAKLRVAENATIDLNGHKLYAPAAVFVGPCTVKGADIDHADDLTTTDASRVSSPTTFYDSTKASNLFNNNYERVSGSSVKTKRVIVKGVNLPLVVTYDFGEGKVVDAYRIWTGPIGNYAHRLPQVWKFEGSNDNANWTPLDAHHVDAEWPSENTHRTYSFVNTTAYRFYRITIEKGNRPDSNGIAYLELVQLEYFNLKPTQGELHVVSAAGENLALSGLTLSGNMRLFVEGPGNIRFTKTQQTYVGGTEICGGTAYVASGKAALLRTDVFGESGGEVVVRGTGSGNAGATSGLLDFEGQTNYTGYCYVLAGGTIQNPGDGAVTDVRLASNSYVKVTSSLTSGAAAWIGGSGIPAYVDLGGRELSATVATGRKFGLQEATLENGCLYVRSGGWFTTTNGVVATNNVLVWVNCASAVWGTVGFDSYTHTQSNKDYNQGDASIDAYGTFKSTAGLYHGVTLHNSATIDLSEMNKALEAVSPFIASTTGEKTLRFEAGAEIGVVLGARKVPKGTPLITWTANEKPDASVKFFRADEGSRYPLRVEDDGLYDIDKGLVILFR